LGRTVRNEAGIKIRQPLSELVIHDHSGRCEALLGHEEIREIVLDELHIKRLTLADDLSQFVTLKAAPSYPVLGKRFGKRVPEIVRGIEGLPADSLAAFLQDGEITLDTASGEVTLGREDMSVGAEGVAPYGGRQERGITVALRLEIDEALRLEGIARELINRLQNLRKKAGFEVSDRIQIRYEGGENADAVFVSHGQLIRDETLSRSADKGPVDWPDTVEFVIEEEPISLWIKRESD
jgi:isoleucyl-tRNA synthetase